jgi:hypothetical protein
LSSGLSSIRVGGRLSMSFMALRRPRASFRFRPSTSFDEAGPGQAALGTLYFQNREGCLREIGAHGERAPAAGDATHPTLRARWTTAMMETLRSRGL